jgi:hypothetical protein
VKAIPGTERIEDEDGDGIGELAVKFDRAEFQAVLPQGEYVPVTVSGIVRDRAFAGEDTIRTLRPTVTNPHGGTHVIPGAPVTVMWTTPSGYQNQITATNLHFSGDNGATWKQIANQIPNTGSFGWTAPDQFLMQCRIMVTLWRGTELFGQGMNQEPFAVTAPVAVRLKSVDARLEDGDAVLRWETAVEAGMEGFEVTRSETERGVYETVTPEMIRAAGEAGGASYEYRDTTIRPNRTYWYKLVEVTSEGLGMEFGPYSVTFRIRNGLEQNVPNPFNPTTTIRYAIAEDSDVRLVIYDVAGRHVRTLVNDRQRADVYQVAWDGVDDHGKRVASGVYFYKLAAGKFSSTKKMMLLK